MIQIKVLIRRLAAVAQQSDPQPSFGREKAAQARADSAKALEAVQKRDKIIKALPALLSVPHRPAH